MWKVRRRWLPHREGKGVRARFRKLPRRKPERPAAPTGKPTARREDTRDGARWFDHVDPFDGCIDGFDDLAVLAVAVLAVLMVLFVFPPLVLLGIDLLWLAFAFLASAVGRFVLGRPWRVEAVGPENERRDWFVKGFSGAGQLRDTLQAEFDAGLDPRPDTRR